MCEVGNQVRHGGFAEVAAGRDGFLRALVIDSPNTAAFAITAGVGQRHLVVADDSVVEVRDVKRPVRSQLQVHGPEPRVVAGQEVRLLDGSHR